MYSKQRHHEIRGSRPFHATDRHVYLRAGGDNLIQTVLAHIAIDDGIGGDYSGKSAVPEQPVNATKEIDHQFTQSRGGIEPLHALAEGMTESATKRLSTQVRRVAQNAVEPVPIYDFRKLNKPVEKLPLLAQCTGSVGAPPLRRVLAAPVAVELDVGDKIRLVAGHLWDVELRNRDVRDGPQVVRVLALGKGGKVFLLGVDLCGGRLGQGRKRLPFFEHSIQVATQFGSEVEGRLPLVLQILPILLTVGRRDLLVVAG